MPTQEVVIQGHCFQFGLPGVISLSIRLRTAHIFNSISRPNFNLFRNLIYIIYCIDCVLMIVNDITHSESNFLKIFFLHLLHALSFKKERGMRLCKNLT